MTARCVMLLAMLSAMLKQFVQPWKKALIPVLIILIRPVVLIQGLFLWTVVLALVLIYQEVIALQLKEQGGMKKLVNVARLVILLQARMKIIAIGGGILKAALGVVP